MEPMTIDLNGCARCDTDGHPALTFWPIAVPVERGEGIEPFTHWATCPTTGEPILLAMVKT